MGSASSHPTNLLDPDIMLVRGREPEITSCTTIMILLLAAQNKSTCRPLSSHQKSAFLDKLMQFVIILSPPWIKKLTRSFFIGTITSTAVIDTFFFGRLAAKKLFLLRILGSSASSMPSNCSARGNT